MAFLFPASRIVFTPTSSALLLSSRYSPSSKEHLRSTSRSEELSEMEKSKVTDSIEEHVHMPPVIPRYRPRTVAPFVPSQDFPRGVMYALSAVLSYLLMLAVM